MCACLRAAAVVLVFDRLPGHALLLVRVLLGGKDGGEEDLLQLLVGKADAELLEGVQVEPTVVVKAELKLCLLLRASEARIIRGVKVIPSGWNLDFRPCPAASRQH